MFYFAELRRHFQALYGKATVRLLKPSTTRDVWLGFDQGWIISDAPESDLFADLQSSVTHGSTTVRRMYLGFFLQFKQVTERSRRSKNTPKGVWPTYHEVLLDLVPSGTTGMSQHETLTRVSQIRDAQACYACPFVFEPEEIYEEPVLDDLRCVPVEDAPTGWRAREDHRLVFRSNSTSRVLWCSEPHEGRAMSFGEWVSEVPRRSPQEMRDFLTSVRGVMDDTTSPPIKNPRFESVPQSLVVVRIDEL